MNKKIENFWKNWKLFSNWYSFCKFAQIFLLKNKEIVLTRFYDFLLKIKVARFWVPMYPTIQIVYNFVLNIAIKANRLLIFSCVLFLLIFLVIYLSCWKWANLVEIIPQLKWNFLIRTDYQNSIHRITGWGA